MAHTGKGNAGDIYGMVATAQKWISPAIGDLALVPSGITVTLLDNRHATLYNELVVEATGTYVLEAGSLLAVNS